MDPTQSEIGLHDVVIEVTDNNGDRVTTFDYYSDGNVKNIEDDLGNKGSYTYYPNGNINSETVTVITTEGEQTVETTWTYDTEGRIESLTDSDNQIEYRYDSNGNLIKVIEGSDETEYRYNQTGQLVETIYPDDTPDNSDDNPRAITVYDRGGRERANISSNGRVTQFEYDAVDRLTATIYPDDSSNQVEQLIAAIAPDQTPETIDWTTVIYPDSTPAYLVGRPRTSTEYYQNGWVKAEIDEIGDRVDYKYDPLGREIEVRYDENNYLTYSYNSLGSSRTESLYAEGTITENVYDSLGNLVAVTNPNNHTTEYEYTPEGLLKAIVDARDGRTEYDYYDSGNLKSIKDALSQVTTYEYNDPQGRQTDVILPDGKRSTTAYNDEENSVKVTDFNGETIEFVYDEFGELQQKNFLSDGALVTYDYDAQTRTETIESDRGTTVYKYDEFGQLLSRTDPIGPFISGSGASIEYGYENGILVELKTPNRTVTYDYYSDGTLKSVTDSQGTTTYHYSDEGALYKTVFPNSVAEVVEYDDLGRVDLVKMVRMDADTGEELEAIASYDYEVDAAGNRREVVDHNGRKVEYEYDELNRLTREKIVEPNAEERIITYVYDAVGNLDYKTDSVEGDTDYDYNNLNQLISSTADSVTTIYTYDDNGNLKSRTRGDRSVEYDWENDGENRLVGVTVIEDGETTEIEYEYNERGIRVGEVVDGVASRYLIDELRPYAQVLEEYDGSGSLETAYQKNWV